jgi:hypothetical protein
LDKLERLPVAFNGARDVRAREDSSALCLAPRCGAYGSAGGAVAVAPRLVGLPFEFAAAAASNLRFRAARHYDGHQSFP